MVDRNHVDLRDLVTFGTRYRLNDDSTILNLDGEELSVEEYELEAIVWRLPTVKPEDIHKGLRALVITDDGGDRGESDYFERITFRGCVEPDAAHAHTNKGRVSLSELGVYATPGSWFRHDVFVIEESKDNILLLDEELERTGYEHARRQLRRIYRRWLT